jgi:hypothetical protein
MAEEDLILNPGCGAQSAEPGEMVWIELLPGVSIHRLGFAGTLKQLTIMIAAYGDLRNGHEKFCRFPGLKRSGNMISEIHNEIGRRYALDVRQNCLERAQVSMDIGNGCDPESFFHH